MATTTFDLAGLPAIDRSKLLLGLVVPRPIGWIGSRDLAGVDNLAPFSFFNVVASTPPTMMFAPGMTVRLKDSLRNVRETGCFTVNLVTEDLAEAMNQSSGDYAPDVDEFSVAGVTKREGEAVPAPMVAEAKASFECRLTHVHEMGDPPTAAAVFGEIQLVHVDSDLLDGTRVDLHALHPIGRLAGPWYSRTRDLFEMERPVID